MSGAEKLYCAEKWIGAERGLKRPSGAAFDKNGETLYLCDMENSRIAVFHLPDCDFRTLGASCEHPGKDRPRKPLALSVKNGLLAVTDAEENAVYLYDGKDGWRRLRTGRRLTLRLPGAIAWGEEDTTYVADFLNKRICEGGIKREMSVLRGIPCGEPYGLYYTEGILYVADAFFGCIRQYHTKTGELHTLSLHGHRPISVTADRTGHIWFSETRALFRLDPEGDRIEVAADRRSFREWGFGRPGHLGSVTPLPDGRIVFTDTLTHCVYCLTPPDISEENTD